MKDRIPRQGEDLALWQSVDCHFDVLRIIKTCKLPLGWDPTSAPNSRHSPRAARDVLHSYAVLLFAKNARETGRAWDSLCKSTSDYRAARKKTIGFKPDDRQHPEDPGEKKA